MAPNQRGVSAGLLQGQAPETSGAMSRPRTPTDPKRPIGDKGTAMRNTYDPEQRADRYSSLKDRPYSEAPK